MSKSLGLIDDRLAPLVYTWQQDWQETYSSGKTPTVVDRGTFTWRATTPPTTDGSGNVTFTACDGTTTVLSPSYGGTLSGVNDPVLLRYC